MSMVDWCGCTMVSMVLVVMDDGVDGGGVNGVVDGQEL